MLQIPYLIKKRSPKALAYSRMPKTHVTSHDLIALAWKWKKHKTRTLPHLRNTCMPPFYLQVFVNRIYISMRINLLCKTFQDSPPLLQRIKANIDTCVFTDSFGSWRHLQPLRPALWRLYSDSTPADFEKDKMRIFFYFYEMYTVLFQSRKKDRYNC
jgi:hypothetical protein